MRLEDLFFAGLLIDPSRSYCGRVREALPEIPGALIMYGDPSWVYWMAGIAAGLALVYLIVVLFNAELLD